MHSAWERKRRDPWFARHEWGGSWKVGDQWSRDVYRIAPLTIVRLALIGAI